LAVLDRISCIDRVEIKEAVASVPSKMGKKEVNEMKKGVAFLVGLACLAVVLSGCATIMSGSDQEVKINSSPAAHVVITANTGQVLYEGEAPATVKRPRKIHTQWP
jgi:uncharacterized protein YceK